MKKNAMLKIAAVLLVAVLLTTCAISSTFAKYVSSYESTAETARVAKWGLYVDTTSIGTQKLFFSEYNDGEGVGGITEPLDGVGNQTHGNQQTVDVTVAITGESNLPDEVTVTHQSGRIE